MSVNEPYQKNPWKELDVMKLCYSRRWCWRRRESNSL